MQALEHGAELDEDEEDDESGYQGREKRIEVTRTPRVYDAEQQQLRQAFLSATQVGGRTGLCQACGFVYC